MFRGLCPQRKQVAHLMTKPTVVRLTDILDSSPTRS